MRTSAYWLTCRSARPWQVSDHQRRVRVESNLLTQKVVELKRASLPRERDMTTECRWLIKVVQSCTTMANLASTKTWSMVKRPSIRKRHLWRLVSTTRDTARRWVLLPLLRVTNRPRDRSFQLLTRTLIGLQKAHTSKEKVNLLSSKTLSK